MILLGYFISMQRLPFNVKPMSETNVITVSKQGSHRRNISYCQRLSQFNAVDFPLNEKKTMIETMSHLIQGSDRANLHTPRISHLQQPVEHRRKEVHGSTRRPPIAGTRRISSLSNKVGFTTSKFNTWR